MSVKKFFQKYGKLILLIALLVLIIIILWALFGDSLPALFHLLKEGDEEAIEAYIQQEGFWKGALAVIAMSALQVVSIVLPGFAIQIAAGIIYGGVRSFFMCYFGFILGNVLVFGFARKMGNQISNIANIDKPKNNWIREKMASANPAFVVGFVNLLPILPNGIIPYIAARSNIRSYEYVMAICVTSWIQILFNCAAGGFLKRGQYLYMFLALGIQIGLLVFATLKRKWIISLIPGGKKKQQKQ